MDTEYNRREEFFHAVTHGLGAVLGAAGTAYLVVDAVGTGNPWRIVSVAIFGATVVLLYGASAAYHGVRQPRLKERLQVLDHAAIYLLIAGTYTPFLLVPLRGGWGWSLFGVIWGLAAAGVVFKLFWIGRFPRLSTGIYLAMGWSIVVAMEPLVRRLSTTTLIWTVAGGLIYTAGTLFYHSSRVPYAHTIWHLFVLGGSVCHFIAIATL